MGRLDCSSSSKDASVLPRVHGIPAGCLVESPSPEKLLPERVVLESRLLAGETLSSS